MRRKKEGKKKITGMELGIFVWNSEYLYGNYGCMEFEYGFVWKLWVYGSLVLV